MTAKLGTILLVDDEEYVRDSLATVLTRRGFEVRCAANTEDALARHELDGIDAIVTDLRMPGAGGLELLRRLTGSEPDLPVVVLTGHGTVASAVECMQAGAAEYLVKPVDPDTLVLLLRRILQDAERRRELDYLRARTVVPEQEKLLGVSPGWKRVVEEARAAAGSDSPVLVLGESGTGKEEIARFVHRCSARRDGPFVAVNCAAIPVELFESEFFGYRRGAFTGAVADRVGRWKVADHGTLFLDEINSLPLLAQPKVLRALQDGQFERLGDSRPTSADVRIICAANVDLGAEAEAGRFRQDLYYRIHVLPVRIPPLRERAEDIPVLAQAFRQEFALRNAKVIRDFRPDALEALCRYPWPGNVRELRNIVERAVLLETGAEVRRESLPGDVTGAAASRAARSSGAAAGADGAAAGAAGGADPAPSLNLRASLRAEERRLIEEALARSGGVRREAARLLGIDERNLSYYTRKHGLRP